jgi:hypothetical protein
MINHEVHKYMRILVGGTKIVKRDGKRYIEKTGGTPIYKCMIPGCGHYLTREMVLGRLSICWKCGGQMVMSAYSVTLKKPHHRECTRSKVA